MTAKAAVPELGPLEYQLLRILWKSAPATAREVLEGYNRKAPKKLKYTTIMTLLTRMVEKRVLEVDRRRQPFQFEPRVTREQMQRDRVNEFVNLFFEGRAVDLAVRLVEETPLSPEAVRRLEASLERHKTTSGTRQKRGAGQ